MLIRNSPPQPAGLPDLHSFTRQEARHFHLNGTPESELEGVKFSLDGGLYDAPTGLSVYVSHPKPSYAAGGTLRPRMTETAMYRKRTVAMWYQRPVDGAQQMQWVNFETGEWENIPAVFDTGVKTVFKAVTLLMSSAIIGKGGSDTGELLVAYPSQLMRAQLAPFDAFLTLPALFPPKCRRCTRSRRRPST